MSRFDSPGLHIPFDELEVQDQMGGGGYSLVYRGIWKGCPVAIKKWFDPDHSDKMMVEFRAEVMTLAELRHPNVVQFLGACMKPPELCMVMEHLPHSLFSVLYKSSVEMDQKRVIALASDICRAFQFLHSRKPAVIHRDIKPANFLLDRSWKVKICDFGLASAMDAASGTPPYMAPELLTKSPYNEKVDVYAFGILLNEMVSRQVPFEGLGFQQIKDLVCRGERPVIPDCCQRKLAEVIEICWDGDASKRPSFAEVQEQLRQASK
ncbi:hypothetical protein BSKO_05985 [Bryopsis sp. KO-2023]|nr:hypothetical protein BSKO_05985 [Bryopsis sp. KO-2023]